MSKFNLNLSKESKYIKYKCFYKNSIKSELLNPIFKKYPVIRITNLFIN